MEELAIELRRLYTELDSASAELMKLEQATHIWDEEGHEPRMHSLRCKILVYEAFIDSVYESMSKQCVEEQCI